MIENIAIAKHRVFVFRDTIDTLNERIGGPGPEQMIEADENIHIIRQLRLLIRIRNLTYIQ